jgi:transcription initiation factor TFIIIB Brf1 subunit/transcription initiation factor TFIIB
MDKKCPCCGNTNEFTPTMLSEEYVCNDCGSEFSEVTNEAYTSPNYRLFCETIIKRMRSNLNDAIISSAIGEIKEGYINDGPEYTKDFIERLSSIATELYMDYKAGLREEYDFSAIMEGIEKLIEFHNIQNPNDADFDYPEEEEEEQENNMMVGNDDDEDEIGVGSDIEIKTPSETFDAEDGSQAMDPMGMVDQNAPAAEKIEHLALATLKNNVEGLKNALNLLNNAEEQERQYGSDEGHDHEEQEAQILEKLKSAINDIQSNLNDYLQNEVNAHYSAPDIRRAVDTISEQLNANIGHGDITSMKQDMQTVCDEACNMLQECGINMKEDAELVTHDEVNVQKDQSISTSTKEMGDSQVDTRDMENPTVTESNIDRIDPELLTPETSIPPSEESELAFNTNNNFTQHSPGAYFGDPGFEDEKEEPGEIEDIPLGNYKQGQDVIFENEHWVIMEIQGDTVLLESDNGETAETNMENIELSDRQGFDEMEDHYERGTDNLRKEWEKIEKSIGESAPLLQVDRMFDPTKFKAKQKGIENFDPEATLAPPKRTPSSLKNFNKSGAIQLPKGGTPAEQKNKSFDPEERIGGKGFGIAYEDAPNPNVEISPIEDTLPNSNVQP